MTILHKIHLGLTYLTRFFLAYVFIPHGIEKITTTIDIQEYHDFGLGQDFIDFYLLWEKTGFIVFIGVLQLIMGLLLIPKKTYLFGAVLLAPMNVGMIATHIYLSKSWDFLIWDALMFILNLYLIIPYYKLLIEVFFTKQKGII